MRKLLLSLALFLTVSFSLPLVLGPAAAPAAHADERRLPVIMYHSILKDPARAGMYVVSPELLRSDLIYLSRHGYETVLPEDLVSYAAGMGTLPEKPVLITFDDGHLNNLTYALPILEELDMHALVSVVGSYTDRYTDSPDPNPAYAYMSWQEIHTLADSGRVAIGNHSYSMHSEADRFGCARRAGESLSSYQAALIGDVGRLQSAFLSQGIDCVTFAYPFGRISPESAEILLGLGLRITLTCYERINVVSKGSTESLIGLGRFNRAAGENSATFFRRVLKDA